ncbi:Fic family protein [Flavobacterium sp. MXW15]|uniref:Fic family protein n=1 Tax=Xanthomonas chitinilytica TaxID=2989819 RepID=A0ABT3JW46_9XANT|nr:Fic family protein [Xanthomonas sp. H13-6]MCW4454928.1 Fic family protein [Flavobacterium sp. MXW15]MCW4472444.1 Fic family protein [Xanthomonas sp. H13-6]
MTIRWIGKPLALAIHDCQLAEHGGGSGVRDDTLPDSALARPQQLHACGNPPPDLADLAASLAFGLARNQPFVDGNRRTAHACYRVLIALNDGKPSATDEEKYIAMLGLAEGSTSEAESAAWLRFRLTVGTGGRVPEPHPGYPG